MGDLWQFVVVNSSEPQQTHALMSVGKHRQTLLANRNFNAPKFQFYEILVIGMLFFPGLEEYSPNGALKGHQTTFKRTFTFGLIFIVKFLSRVVQQQKEAKKRARGDSETEKRKKTNAFVTDDDD